MLRISFILNTPPSYGVPSVTIQSVTRINCLKTLPCPGFLMIYTLTLSENVPGRVQTQSMQIRDIEVYETLKAYHIVAENIRGPSMSAVTFEKFSSFT